MTLEGYLLVRELERRQSNERARAITAARALIGEHELMATWMKADLVSAEAQLKQMKKSVAVIDDKIFTVQLYAGLVEELVQIKKGKPAPDDAKVHLFQRRHYMDEECLARYEADGMEFKDIKAFDRWICKRENMTRILPMERSIVAFRVRRNMKNRGAIDSFVRFELENADKLTFLYIRNGDQLWRLITEIDFGVQLFPNREDHELLASKDPLYVDVYWGRVKAENIVTENQYLGIVERKRQHEHDKAEYTKMWNALSKEERKKRGVFEGPYHKFSSHDTGHQWERVDKDSVYYDDVMREIARMLLEHNRIATTLQGLLDRSECLHPHPPWKIWTAEGFKAGIECVFDDTNTLTPGDAPDFETYRARLALSIKVGSLTIGQEDAWERREAVKENKRRDNEYARRGRYREQHLSHYRPHGNKGPGFIAKVESIRGDACKYTWSRERERRAWVDNPDRPGWLKKDETTIDDSISVPTSKLFNVSAYTPGDFHLFYDDPRTRAQYLKWAPFLLAAEDHKAGKRDETMRVRHAEIGGDRYKKDDEEGED